MVRDTAAAPRRADGSPPAGAALAYCRRCILPSTRPNLVLDEHGVCGACRAHAERPAVDWEARAQEFATLAERARRAAGAGYDCLVPVSGGKDSTWQVVTCLEHGLRPLCVSWRPPARTAIGERNLRNLVALGVDHIDYSIDPGVERRFALAALRRRGDAGIPMHLALFAIPLTIAVRFGVPLVLWGENSASEYGTVDGEGLGMRLSGAWLRRFGVNGGTTWHDWVSDDLSERDLLPYAGPDPDALEAAGVRAVFLGHFFPWDPERSFAVARRHGFQADGDGPRVGIYAHSDMDDPFIAVHHHLKWHKFGFTRAWDNLSLEIRNGRLTREEAIAAVACRGEETPHVEIERFCDWVGIARADYDAIADGFRDPRLWTRRDGRWVIDDFLIRGWEWA